MNTPRTKKKPADRKVPRVISAWYAKIARAREAKGKLEDPKGYSEQKRKAANARWHPEKTV